MSESPFDLLICRVHVLCNLLETRPSFLEGTVLTLQKKVKGMWEVVEVAVQNAAEVEEGSLMESESGGEEEKGEGDFRF